MPDIWTHILCGTKTIEIIENEELYLEIMNRVNIFKFGTQGPDIFYYYRFWKGINGSGGKMLGRLMHTNRTGEFLINCLKYLKCLSNSNAYLELLTYIMGFISHYSLDSIAHPYIYYYALSQSNDNDTTYLVNSYHKKLEIIIDTIYQSENLDLSSGGIPPYKAIDLGICVPNIIADCLVSEIEHIYNFSIKKRIINDAYRDMKVGLKLLYDPTNIKLKMVKLLEKLLKTPGRYSCAIYPIHVDNNFDYMNNIHNEWKPLYNNQEVFSDSFNDLFNRAVLESRNKIRASIDFLDGKISEFELTSFFPNISYLTGK